MRTNAILQDICRLPRTILSELGLVGCRWKTALFFLSEAVNPIPWMKCQAVLKAHLTIIR